jgi:hypothetical protein
MDLFVQQWGTYRAVLHQVTASVVHDHGVGHPLFAEFKGGEAGALVAGPGLIHKHVNAEPGPVRLVDRREGHASIHRGQPTGIAVGEHI